MSQWIKLPVLALTSLLILAAGPGKLAYDARTSARVSVPLELPELAPGETELMTQDAVALELERVYGLSEARANQFSAWILDASDGSGVPPSLLASVIMTESSFRVNVRSPVGAIGPGQVRPEIWAGACSHFGDLTEPAANIACAAEILVEYWVGCSYDWYCALASYNLGPSGVVRAADGGARYVGRVASYLALHESPGETVLALVGEL